MASQEDVNKLVAAIQVLKNRDLASICSKNDLPKSGNKAELQKRIVNLIDLAVHDHNQRRFQYIKNTILQITNGTPPTSFTYGASYLGSSSPTYTGQSGMSSPYAGAIAQATPASGVLGYNGSASGSEPGRRPIFSHQGLQFKPSPFYEIEAAIGGVHTCEVMTQHRSSLQIKVRAAAYPDLQRCNGDPSIRALLFCAGGKQAVQDIAFPYQCEIKINTGDVKANLRGLKNKPGSTRPVDITDYLRLKPTSYENSLDFTYALTSKPFYLAIYVCKIYSATVLAGRIEKRSRITKASVIREMTRQAQDPDIVATSTVLSLKCPLTYMRLVLPVRSTTCKHIQCFDATSYLQLQEQGPQWLCPVCSNPAPYDSLAVDEYVKDILENTSSDLEQVTIEPDGRWHTGKNSIGGGGGSSFSTPPPPPSGPATTAASLVDDEFEILSTPVPRRNGHGPGTGTGTGTGARTGHPSDWLAPASSSAAATSGYAAANGGGGSSRPGLGSRDTTATPSQVALPSSVNSNNKRPREVIDLTLSSDDDDDGQPVQRPFKRQNVGFGGSPTPYADLLRGPGGGPSIS